VIWGAGRVHGQRLVRKERERRPLLLNQYRATSPRGCQRLTTRGIGDGSWHRRLTRESPQNSAPRAALWYRSTSREGREKKRRRGKASQRHDLARLVRSSATTRRCAEFLIRFLVETPVPLPSHNGRGCDGKQKGKEFQTGEDKAPIVDSDLFPKQLVAAYRRCAKKQQKKKRKRRKEGIDRPSRLDLWVCITPADDMIFQGTLMISYRNMRPVLLRVVQPGGGKENEKKRRKGDLLLRRLSGKNPCQFVKTG